MSLEIVNDYTVTNTEEATKKYGNCKFILIDTDINGENGWLYAISKTNESYIELNTEAQKLAKQGKNVLTSGFYNEQLQDLIGM